MASQGPTRKGRTMRAAVWTAYGPPDVLQLREVETPTPKDDEVLVRVHATTVSAGDTEVRSMKIALGLGVPMRLFVGLRRPKRITILGTEFAGVIEAVGDGVTRFAPGDAVFGQTGETMGAYAEYVRVSQDGTIAAKSADLSFEEAATISLGGLEALHFLHRARVQDGESVLVLGAGGSIGTAAVQLAKVYGAEVTAVDSGEKLDMLRSIGADHVIDYTQEDVTRQSRTYDIIFDVPGKGSYGACMRSLRDGGRFLVANPHFSTLIRAPFTRITSGKRVIPWSTEDQPDDLQYLKKLYEEGKMRPVVARTFPLEEIADAHRFQESGEKLGSIVVTVAEGPTG